MTLKIPKSTIAPFPFPYEEAASSFARLVDAYIAELKAWHEHDIQVQAHKDTPLRDQPHPHDFRHIENKNDSEREFWKEKAKWDREKLARFEPYPKPIANPNIVAAVTTRIEADGEISYVPDFEIVNDDPTEEEIIRVKKDQLMHQVLLAEDEAKKKASLPPGKQRIATLREVDIRSKDKGLLQKATNSMSQEETIRYLAENLDDKLRKLRDTGDQNHLDEQETRRQAIESITRTSAHILSEIEDLTSNNIDKFSIPSFS